MNRRQRAEMLLAVGVPIVGLLIYFGSMVTACGLR
jgi:hypothetical protein